jgi:hypothetical protein
MQKRKTVSPQMSLLVELREKMRPKLADSTLFQVVLHNHLFYSLTSPLFSFILCRIFHFDGITCQSCSITASNITNEREGPSAHLRGGDENAHLTG